MMDHHQQQAAGRDFLFRDPPLAATAPAATRYYEEEEEEPAKLPDVEIYLCDMEEEENWRQILFPDDLSLFGPWYHP